MGLIALNWSLTTLPFSTIQRICASRVLTRGDNHQSLRPSGTPHEDVIWQFITGAEEVSCPGEVDEVIEMDIKTENLEDSLKTAAKGLVGLIKGLEMPSDDEIKEACDIAKGYKVSIKKDDVKGKKAMPVRYYAFLPEFDLDSIVGQALSASTVASVPQKALGDVKAFWDQLKKADRLTKRPHITVTHVKNPPETKPIWDACANLDSLSFSPPSSTKPSSTEPSFPLFKFKLGTLLCDQRVMSVTIEQLEYDSSSTAPDSEVAKSAIALLNAFPPQLKSRFHITVGTKDDTIEPFQGGILVEKWRKGGPEVKEIVAIPVVGPNKTGVVGSGRLRGLAG